MWAIIKFKENNFETLKKDLRKKNINDYLFYEETHKKLIDMGIAVFYIDNF